MSLTDAEREAEQNLKSALTGLEQSRQAVVKDYGKVVGAIETFTGKKTSSSVGIKKKGTKNKKRVTPTDDTDQDNEIDELEDTSVVSKSKQKKKKQDKEKKPRKVRDPDAPKAPANPYIRFRTSIYQDTKSRFPELNPQQLTAKIGELWNSMSEKQQQPFVEEFKQAQGVWVEETKTYKENKLNGTSTSSTIQDQQGDVSQGGEGQEEEEESEIDPYDEQVLALEKKRKKKELKRERKRVKKEEQEKGKGKGKEPEQQKRKSKMVIESEDEEEEEEESLPDYSMDIPV